MFDFNTNAPYPVVTVLLVLFALWMGQFVLSWLQIQRFYKRFRALRRESYLTSIGVSGRVWTRKIYAVLVVDEKHQIKYAEALQGWTVFSNLKSIPQLIGQPMERLWEEPLIDGISEKLWDAFMDAAEYIEEHEEKKQSASEESTITDSENITSEAAV